ncbi:hypothetical protein V8G54_030865 [Vigna mungo]|uniref:Uncharacterized protein n=1 Tax=Vigna mungo TaxID=3915 RepID=A0AAQ3MXT2_VIGMU
MIQSIGVLLISGQSKLEGNGRAANIIDPTLNNALGDEIMRCIHIALLCVQEKVVEWLRWSLCLIATLSRKSSRWLTDTSPGRGGGGKNTHIRKSRSAQISQMKLDFDDLSSGAALSRASSIT